LTLYHYEAYEIVSDEARVDLRAGTAEGDNPVSGHGPLGEIEGTGFRIWDGGNTIIVLGKARLTMRDLPETVQPEAHQ
jgi:lipopolysaccharide export system protein LptC